MKSRFLERLAVAVAIGTSVSTALNVQPVAGYCTDGFSNWSDSTQELQVWIDIPDSWDAAVSASRHAWNNIDEDLIYWYPHYNATTVGTFNLFTTDFSDAGLPSGAAGYTYNNLISQPHTVSDIHLNTDFTWNTTGVMDRNLKKADVRTVLTHEIGHASGLAHPIACGPMTPTEIAAVMNVEWKKKWALNSDDILGITFVY